MPTYEFKCRKCHNLFEKLMNYSEIKEESGKKITECYCGGIADKMVSGFSFRMTGMGKIKVDKTRQDGGIPIGEMKGDEDYAWMKDPNATGGPTP